MLELYIFVKTNMAFLVGFSAILQIIGTLVLALFSFVGIKISPSPNVYMNRKPATHVAINRRWLLAARAGLIVLLVGIFLSGIAGVVAAISV
jgi:uncharacterized membrane protein